MRGLELLPELGEGSRQRRRGEHGERPGRRRTARTWRGGSAARAARDGDCRQAGGYNGKTAHFRLLIWALADNWDTDGRNQPGCGISTETLVAFTVATASIPGSRPSSSAASRLSSDTNRCGPAWIST